MWDLPPDDEEHAIDVMFQILDTFLAEREAAQNTRSPGLSKTAWSRA